MSPSHLTVIRAGLFDSVQTSGRIGGRAFGVPAGGPFDPDANGLANALVGNDPRSSTIELTGFGGLYEAGASLAIALAGAPMTAEIERARGGCDRLAIPQSAVLLPGDRLALGGTDLGLRTYLAARGGWRPLRIAGNRLHAGDLLKAGLSWGAVRRPAQPSSWESYRPGPIRILDGPDAAADPIPWENLGFRVEPDSNRMGLRLSGPTVEVIDAPERLSAPVAPGTVQVAGGRLIILGPDGGTMGGYPHVAHVISADLSRLGQLRPGDGVQFVRVSLDEARQVDRDDRRRRAERLSLIRTAVADEPDAICYRPGARDRPIELARSEGIRYSLRSNPSP